MLEIETIGTEPSGPAILRRMHFAATKDGQIAHRIAEGDQRGAEGPVRAIVPPEGWQDLCAAYPAAQPLVDAMRSPAQVQA